MLNTLNFKHIYYFWVVATEGSIVRAASKTNVSPSSISEQIKVLESRIGVELFERASNQLSLSQYGQRVFKEVDPFFYSTEELFESIVNHKTTNVRFLRIGVAPDIAENICYQMTYPFIEDINYTVRLIQGENSYLKKAFLDNEIDMVLSTNQSLIPKAQSEHFILKKESYAFVCSKKFKKGLKNKVFPLSIDQMRFINYTNDSDLHFKIYNFFNKKKVNPLRIAEIDDISISKKLVTQGLGFALLPLNSIQADLKKGTLVKLYQSSSFDLPLTYYFKKSFKEDRFISHLDSLKLSD